MESGLVGNLGDFLLLELEAAFNRLVSDGFDESVAEDRDLFAIFSGLFGHLLLQVSMPLRDHVCHLPADTITLRDFSSRNGMRASGDIF